MSRRVAHWAVIWMSSALDCLPLVWSWHIDSNRRNRLSAISPEILSHQLHTSGSRHARHFKGLQRTALDWQVVTPWRQRRENSALQNIVSYVYRATVGHIDGPHSCILMCRRGRPLANATRITEHRSSTSRRQAATTATLHSDTWPPAMS